MLLAPGLFATLSLPVYASNDPVQAGQSPRADLASGSTQSLTVQAGTTDQITRDGFSATSVLQLQNIRQAQARAANIAAYLRSGAQALGDDYPWPVAQTYVSSPLGYYYRECVDFVAWRLNRDAGSFAPPFKYVWADLTPLGGNASDWKRNWLHHGWQTSTKPVAGAVAWWSFHVAYVKSVSDDGKSVVLEDYNLAGTHRYDIRTVPTSSVTLYLYPPPA